MASERHWLQLKVVERWLSDLAASGRSVSADVVHVFLSAFCEQAGGGVTYLPTYTVTALVIEQSENRSQGRQRIMLPCPDQFYKLLIPIFYSHHFVLAVIESNQRHISFYDSIEGYQPSARDHHLSCLLRHAQMSGYNVNAWRNVPCEQQKPGSNDCAIFVIRNAAAVLGRPDRETWGRPRVRAVVENWLIRSFPRVETP